MASDRLARDLNVEADELVRRARANDAVDVRQVEALRPVQSRLRVLESGRRVAKENLDAIDLLDLAVGGLWETGRKKQIRKAIARRRQRDTTSMIASACNVNRRVAAGSRGSC